MPLSSRELWLILRARDEASRTVRNFSSALLASGSAAQRASLQAQAATMRQTATMMRQTGATKAQIATVMANAKALDREAKSLRDNDARRRRMVGTMHNVSSAMTSTGITMALVGGATVMFFKRSVDAAVEYEKAVRLTKTQTDGFKTSLNELAEIGRKVARGIAVPFEEIQPALFDIFSSTQANVKQSKILLEGFSKAAVAGQVSIQDASRATIAVMNAFNIPLENVNDVLDIQFEMVRKGVGTYGEFSKVLGRIVTSGNRAGQNFEMIAGMLAFLTRNGLSAAMAATSGARALEAMSHPRTVQRLEKMGIKVKDAKGNFLPLTDVLTALKKKLDELPPTKRVAKLVDILKGAGGTIQARRFLEQVLLKPGELEEFIGFVDDMNKSSGAFKDAYDEMAASVAAKSQLLANRWDLLKESAGRALIPIFKQVIDIVIKAIDWFESLPKGVQKGAVIFAVIAGAALIILGIFALVVAAVVGIVAAFTALGATGAIVIGIIAAIVIAVIALWKGFKFLWENSKGFRDFIIGAWKGIWDLLAQPLSQLWKTLKEGFSEAWKSVQEAFKDVDWDLVLGFLKGLGMALLVIAGIVVAVIALLIRIILGIVTHAIKPVFNAIAGIISGIIKIFFGLIEFFQAVFTGQWGKAWEAVKKIFAGVWQVIFSLLKGVIGLIIGIVRGLVEGVVGFFQWLWKILVGNSIIPDIVKGIIKWFNQAANFIRTIWNAIKGFFKAVLNAIVGQFRSWINTARGIFNWFSSLAGMFRGWFNSVKDAAVDRLRSMVSFIKSIPGKIKSALGNLKSLLFNAGKQVIQGLINGIKNMIGAVGSAMKSIVNKIKGYLPSSPAKEGPLRSKPVKKSGLMIGRQLAQGLLGSERFINDAASRLAAAAAFDSSGTGSLFAGRVGVGLGRGAALPTSRNVQQTFNITTQEIDPRVHAARLGWEIEMRS